MTEYRLFEGVDGPATQVSEGADFVLAVEFYVDSPAWATKLHLWQSTPRTGTYLGRLYKVDAGGTTGSAVAGSDVTFNGMDAGWNAAEFTRGVPLTVGQHYRAAILVITNDGFTATGNYWGAFSGMGGSAGRTAGPLHAPNQAAAIGSSQGSAILSSTMAFPSGESAANFWVDVSVSDVDFDAVNMSLYVVDRDTGDLTALPHFTHLAVGQLCNGVGTITVDYPYYGLNFDLLAGNVGGDRDVEVEIWTGGKRSGALRGILTDTAGDDTAEDAVWRFDGWDLTVLLDEVLVWPQTGNDKQELVLSAATAGVIIDTLIDQAQARGGLEGVTTGFTRVADSTGTTWASVVTATFSPSATLLDVLGELVELGLIDGFQMGADRVLDMWNPGGRGTDRTLGDRPVIFRRGQNLVQSPRRHTVRNSATTVLAAGAENLYRAATNATALSRRGRRIEVAGSANTISDGGAVTAYAQTMLATVTPGGHEIAHGLVFGDGHPRPLVDYQIGDWVWSDTRGALERLRVQQLEIECGPDGYNGSVVLNTLIVDRVAALARKVKRMSSGTAVVGTSTFTPEVDDGKAPAQVIGVVASSTAYVTNAGVTQAAMQAAWTAVTTNADGSVADDIVGYIPAYRYNAGGLPSDWQILPRVTTTLTDWSGVAAGKTVEVRVAAVDKFSRLGAWSDTYTLTSGADSTPPQTPSTPFVSSYLGILKVDWNGQGNDSLPMPPDFDRVDIHISLSAGFTPTSGNRIGSLYTRGSFPWADGSYGLTFFAKLVAYDKTGNASTPSGEGLAQLVRAGDGDISSLSVGLLRTGILSAIMTVSGIIRTSDSGSRVELDSNGIRCYNAAGAAVFEYNIFTGQANMIGSFQAGSGTDVIRIQPNTSTGRPEIYMDAIGGGATPAYMNAVPIGSVNLTGLNSGTDLTGFTQGTVKLSPNEINLFINTAPGNNAGVNKRRGAYFFGTTTLAAMGVTYTGSEDIRAEVRCNGGNIDAQALGSIQMQVQSGDGSRNGGFLWLRPEANGDTYIGKLVGGFVDSYLRFGDSGAGAQIDLANSTGARLTIQGDGTTLLGAGGNTFIRLNDGGNIQFQEGSGTSYGSLSALKSFVIPHPTDPDRLLVHGCTESPQAGVEYWGEVVVAGGVGEVGLPGYFEAATRPEGRQVQCTPVDELCLVAASPIVDGRFTVRCTGPDGTRVSWLVKAVRADVPLFDPEPLRSAVDVHGDGPYRYIQPRVS